MRAYAICVFLYFTFGSVIAVAHAPDAIAQEPPIFSAQRIYSPTFSSKIYTVYMGDRKNPPVILVHGLGQAGWLDWQHVIPALAKNHYVVTFDLPGFGRSSATTQALTPAHFAHLVDEIRQHYFGGKKVSLIGHSLGGAVALKYATSYGDNLERLVLINAAGIVHRSVFMQHVMRESLRPKDALYSQLYDLAVPVINRVGTLALTGLEALPDPSVFLVENSLARHYLLGDRSNLQAALGLMLENFSLDLEHLSIPTHIIWGAQDPVAPLRTGEVLTALLPQAELIIIPHAGHVPMKTNTASFNAVLQSTLLRRPNKQNMVAQGMSVDLVNCVGQENFYFSGIAKKISLNHCNDAFLENVSTSDLEIRNSRVRFKHLVFTASEKSIMVRSSRILITGGRITAPVAFTVEDAFIDGAGLTLHSEKSVWAGRNGRAFFSLSQRRRKDHEVESLHDVYKLTGDQSND